ncbi:MAG: hypothetical protein ACO3LD_07065 [Luminiphilus sp.]|jgi:hypothetical protein
MKRYLYTDPYTKKEVTMEQASDGSTIIHQKQRFDDVIKINKHMSGDYSKGQMIGNTQRHIQHVAEIPVVVYNHLLQTLGPPRENPKAWKAWLNDHQNRDFRTGGGTL